MFRRQLKTWHGSIIGKISRIRNRYHPSYLRCLDDLHFKSTSHKQSGSEIKVKVGSGSEKNNFGSTTLVRTTCNNRHLRKDQLCTQKEIVDVAIKEHWTTLLVFEIFLIIY
jgi:hypothetical protein